MMSKPTKKQTVQALVHTAVESYAAGFENRHISEVNNPSGTINMKIHNVFIAALGPEVQYYTALVRSLDSSLGNMLEKLAINIARLSFEVKKKVEGPLSKEQTQKIAELLEEYKRHEKKPAVTDYTFLRKKPSVTSATNKRHESDYYLYDKEAGYHYLIELKIGGDLDNKKARSEKEAVLEQYAILSNILDNKSKIKIYFATAYNRFGEGQPWNQERVKQYFAREELLIGKDFWNLVCKSSQGYSWVLESYKKNAHLIKEALKSIKTAYLG